MVENLEGGRFSSLIAQRSYYSLNIGLSKIVPAASVKRL